MTDPNTESIPRIAVIQHDEDVPAGYLGLALEDAGATIETYRDGNLPSLENGLVDAVVILGGEAHPERVPGHEWQQAERDLVTAAADAGVPVLGVCLGAQLVAQAHGGDAVESAEPEIAWSRIKVLPEAGEDELFAGAPWPEKVLAWHYWEISPGPGTEVLAASSACVQAIRAAPLAWGTQFHFEADPSIVAAWISSGIASPEPGAHGKEVATRGGSGPGARIAPDNEMLRDERRFLRQREFSWHVGHRFVEIVRRRKAESEGEDRDVRS